MKKQTGPILLFLFALYLVLSTFSYMHERLHAQDDIRNAFYRGFSSPLQGSVNQTSAFNKSILGSIFSYEEDRKHNREYDKEDPYTPIFGFFHLQHMSDTQVTYYITNLYDVDLLLEKYKISNSKHINYKKRKGTLPISDPAYASFFQDHFTKEKKEAHVTGTNKQGFAQFDIAPDALLLATVEDTIVGYGYVDNRLLDCRDYMNIPLTEAYQTSLDKDTGVQHTYLKKERLETHIAKNFYPEYNHYRLVVKKIVYDGEEEKVLLLTPQETT